MAPDHCCQEKPLNVKRTWTRGGDCEILETEDDIEAAVIDTTDAHMHRTEKTVNKVSRTR